MSRTISLTKGYEVIVDDEDFSRLNIFIWQAEIKSNTVYAKRTASDRTNMYMHRYILDAKPGKFVDHLDGNGLNNTKNNIRVLSHSANCAKRKTKGIFSGVKKRASGRYRVQIARNGHTKDLGTYDTAEEAIEVRKIAEIEWHGVELRGET